MKVLLFLFIITISVNAQFISPYENFNFDYSDNITHSFAIGNYGFDNQLNSYNPNIVQSANHWFFEAGLMSNISQNLKWNDIEIFKSKVKIYPNFTCQYQNDWLGIQISYKNNIISSIESSDNRSWTFSFPAQYVVSKMAIPTLSTSIQLSSILLVEKGFTLNAGVITNNFITKFDFGDFGSIEYSNNYFDNLQFSAGANYNLDNLFKFYLQFKSASNDNKLDITPAITSIESPSLDEPNVYYNGLLAVGINYSICENLGISIESNSDFNSYKTPYPNNYSINSDEGSIFNTSLIGGINLKPIDNIKLGLSVTKYLEYKNPFFTGYEREIESTPLSINFGTSYNFNLYTLSLFYQYSKISFKSNGLDFTESENSHYLGLNIGVEI